MSEGQQTRQTPPRAAPASSPLPDLTPISSRLENKISTELTKSPSFAREQNLCKKVIKDIKQALLGKRSSFPELDALFHLEHQPQNSEKQLNLFSSILDHQKLLLLLEIIQNDGRTESDGNNQGVSLQQRQQRPNRQRQGGRQDNTGGCPQGSTNNMLAVDTSAPSSTLPAAGGGSTPPGGGSTPLAAGGGSTPPGGGSTPPGGGSTPPSGGSTPPAAFGGSTPPAANINLNNLPAGSVDPNLQAPVDPNQQAPVDPNQQAPVDPNQQAPVSTNNPPVSSVDPNQQAPVDPNQQAPVDPNQQAPVSTNNPPVSSVDPNLQAPVDPNQQAPVDPNQQPPVDPNQQAPVSTNNPPVSSIDPNQQAPVDPNQQAPVDPNQQAPVSTNNPLVSSVDPNLLANNNVPAGTNNNLQAPGGRRPRQRQQPPPVVNQHLPNAIEQYNGYAIHGLTREAFNRFTVRFNAVNDLSLKESICILRNTMDFDVKVTPLAAFKEGVFLHQVLPAVNANQQIVRDGALDNFGWDVIRSYSRMIEGERVRFTRYQGQPHTDWSKKVYKINSVDNWVLVHYKNTGPMPVVDSVTRCVSALRRSFANFTHGDNSVCAEMQAELGPV